MPDCVIERTHSIKVPDCSVPGISVFVGLSVCRSLVLVCTRSLLNGMSVFVGLFDLCTRSLLTHAHLRMSVFVGLF